MLPKRFLIGHSTVANHNKAFYKLSNRVQPMAPTRNGWRGDIEGAANLAMLDLMGDNPDAFSKHATSVEPAQDTEKYGQATLGNCRTYFLVDPEDDRPPDTEIDVSPLRLSRLTLTCQCWLSCACALRRRLQLLFFPVHQLRTVVPVCFFPALIADCFFFVFPLANCFRVTPYRYTTTGM